MTTTELRLAPSSRDLTFEGVGAVSAGASSRLLIDYPEPIRSHLLDMLFLPRYGAAFQSLKVEIGGDMNSTDGSEPSHMRAPTDLNFQRGYEWWLLREAVERNPAMTLDCLAWGAPGWFQGGYWSDDCACYLIAFLRGAREHHGLRFATIGLWNERPFEAEWVKRFRRRLDAEGFAEVAIVASDMNGPPEHQWRAAEEASVDPELAAAIGVFGVHYPYTVPPASARSLRDQGKRLWSSEDGEWDWGTMLPLEGRRAEKINRNLVERELTKTMFWSAIDAYASCLPAPYSGVITADTPWSGHFRVKWELWHVAHTTHFVDPGWVFLREASRLLVGGGSVAVYRSADGEETTLVAETTGATEPQRLRILAEGIDRFRVIVTDADRTFEPVEDVVVASGICEVTLTPNQVLTLSTRGSRGRPPSTAPEPKPFPLPYRDAFLDGDLGRSPRYLADFSWAFELAEQNDERFLRQVVERQGITWVDLPYAATYAGDPDWAAIRVSARVMLEPGENRDDWAGVVARAHPGATWDAFKKPYPHGLTLATTRGGRWRLTSDDAVLAEGECRAPEAGWSHLEVSAVGQDVVATVDGRTVAEVRTERHPRGLAGLACGCHPARFSSFEISEPA